LAGTSQAQDADEELWLNPSATRAIDDRTEFEVETALRYRQNPRLDTHYVRAWIKRDDDRDNTWSVGIEQRYNGADQREVRFLQQVSYSWGLIDFRTRTEQRFVSTDSQTGFRIRQRIGTDIPLQEGDGWTLTGNAELAVTVRATEPDGQTGLTGLRTFIGFERTFGRYDLSVGYLRQQDIRDGAPDRIGHAPFLGVNVAF
jgi:hypothetical protein